MRRDLKQELKRKLERAEALYQRPGTPGEKAAAAYAIHKLRGKLTALDAYLKPKPEIQDYVFTVFRDA
ncbi:hypothetical protein K2X33_12615 [bacterium]|nr:hypothetical protein [bacterium]